MDDYDIDWGDLSAAGTAYDDSYSPGADFDFMAGYESTDYSWLNDSGIDWGDLTASGLDYNPITDSLPADFDFMAGYESPGAGVVANWPPGQDYLGNWTGVNQYTNTLIPQAPEKQDMLEWFDEFIAGVNYNRDLDTAGLGRDIEALSRDTSWINFNDTPAIADYTPSGGSSGGGGISSGGGSGISFGGGAAPKAPTANSGAAGAAGSTSAASSTNSMLSMFGSILKGLTGGSASTQNSNLVPASSSGQYVQAKSTGSTGMFILAGCLAFIVYLLMRK